MSEPEPPAALLRRAASLVRERADAAEADIMRNPWWGREPGDDTSLRYRAGVSGGLGGPAGEMAAAWDLAAARAVAAWLDSAAQDAEVIGPDPFAVTAALAYLGGAAETEEPR